MKLRDIMEFDHVIKVDENGNVVDDVEEIWPPDLFDDTLDGTGWEFFSAGYTGQDSYNGPIMHDSEYIGGALERDILAQPGYYVRVASYYTCGRDIPEGWAVAYQPLEDVSDAAK